jgi:arginine deiminase
VGWLTLFRAGTGEAKELGEKLGNYLLEQGYEIIPVGGEKGNMREEQYLDERALYELSLQAANVVQLAPGKVIAYAHNKYTNQALRQRGVKVLAFEGKYLADSLGGPHCLTMPLVRKQKLP